MANGYIGKISAVVTASTADLERKLRGAKGEVERFGRSLNSTIASASRSAENSLNGIFTPLQKLQRALQAGSNGRLNLVSERDVARIQQLTQAAREVAAPLKGVAAGFDRISNAISGEFTPALNLAQQQTKLLERGIQTFGGVSERAFTRVRQRAEETAQSFSRIREAASAASGLATGQELRFTNPALAAENARAAALQARAASLPADQVAGVSGLVAQQRQASEEAARLLARLENIRATRRGDATDAELAISAQVDAYGRVNAKLEEQITLFTTIEGLRKQAAKTADEFGATEFARRDGKIQRANAASFEDATADILAVQPAKQGVFTQTQRTVESELARTAALREKFFSLPPAVQKSLEQERATLNSIGNAAREGAVGAGVLAAANDRMAAAINKANLALTEQERLAAASKKLTIDTDESDRLSRESRLESRQGMYSRLTDRLAPSVTAVRERVAGLADPLRESVGPAVDELTNKFRTLSRQGVGVAGADVQRLKGDILSINAALDSRASIGDAFSQSFGGSGAAGLGLGVDQKSLRAVGGEIEFVQQKLGRLAADVRGPTLQALDAFRARARELFDGGAIDTSEGRAELDALRKKFVELLSVAGGGSVSKISGDLKRAGDIARGASGNVGLAVQQAIFAVDDFFSVTGGLDQRIRAAGNNISQLAFILGGTYGLAAGVAITVTAQLAAGLIKFYNEGRTAKDNAEALSESLKKQSTIADELRRAFERLDDTLLEGGFSRQAEGLRRFRKELEDVSRLLRDAREERVVELDPDVLRARADVIVAQNETANASTPGQALAAQQRLLEARQREEEARNRVLQQAGGAEFNQIFDRLGRAVQTQYSDNRSLLMGGTTNEIENRRARGLDAVADARDQARAAKTAEEAARIQLEAARGQLEQVRSSTFVSTDAAAQIEQVIRELELRLQEIGVDNAVVAAREQSFGAAQSVANAQSRLDSSSLFDRGQALDAASNARQEALRQLEAARLTPDIDRRQAAVEAASRGLAEADKKAQEVANKFISVISSVEAFKSALDRVSGDLSNTVAQEARSAADQARRDMNAAWARDVRLDSPASERDVDFAARRRRRLEDDAREAEAENFRLQQVTEMVRKKFEADAAAGNLGADAQDRIRQRDEAQAIIDDANSTREQVADATARRNRAIFELDRLFENSPEAQERRLAANVADMEAQQRRQRDADILRGRELAETPASKAGRELADNLRGLDAYFNDQVEGKALTRQEADAQLGEARRRQVDEAFRSQAPAIASLSDSVANAVLQGPSRAALNATDVSTVEGARELNRLIRGDDAAKDQNLEELRRQSGKLDELIQAVKDNGGDVAN